MELKCNQMFIKFGDRYFVLYFDGLNKPICIISEKEAENLANLIRSYFVKDKK